MLEKIPALGGNEEKSSQEDLDWAFPDVGPGQMPFGGRVIVQLRRTKNTTASKIILVSETKENEKWQNMIGKVVCLGELAFKNRDTGASWIEGTWAKVGDYVRVPKWGGDRWERMVVSEDGTKEPVLFMTLNDHELIAKITDDPLSFKAFV